MKKLISMSLLLLTGFVMNSQNWVNDIDDAKKMASEKNVPIILVFQGSDWCAPCIKLDKEIWSTQEFIEYANEHYVMLKADFPRKKKNALEKEQQEKNNKLAENYNKNGYFPFVVVLNNEGKVLNELGYKKSNPNDYIKLLNSTNN
ncbi:MAG: thioredoxin family protein [Mycoplasmataceae bacterium]|nr:thioredoxin family protein [Mycoplasmataceae bacterium]